ncbi:MAG TPA: hypothetical protein VHA52_00940 [Candidatus Babeliaceae bacterium]|nr:hypothetical protein [Candidatus Babeliaceae bacterium]
MSGKHVAEQLIEANKKISGIINKIENDQSLADKLLIQNINEVIRQLDSVVEQLEKH